MYLKPKMTIERFHANEYVAACGDSGTNYFFECDAGIFDADYDVYQTTSKGTVTGGTLLTRDRYPYIDSYTPCHITHQTNGQNDFYFGYMVANDGVDGRSGTKTPVIIWKGPNNDDLHCSTKLNMSTWKVSRS